MIAGAAKAGSTSLLAYLGQHPGLRVQRSQEMTFFRIDREYRLGYERAFRRYWGRVEEDGGAILAKNAGMMYSPEALDRLWWHNPDTVLLISLRDPAERAFSHYWHSRGGGREPLREVRRGHGGRVAAACAWRQSGDLRLHGVESVRDAPP